MKGHKPTACRPQAYDLLARQLIHIDTSAGLLAAAVAVSMHELEHVEVAEVDATIQRLADAIARRVVSDDPKAKLAHMHAYLFEEEGFRGDSSDYNNPLNSYLPMVLTRRLGLPITLTLVYKLVGDRLELPIFGINAPGHFLAGIEQDGGLLLIDPFDRGRELSHEEAFDLIEHAAGAAIERVDEWFLPIDHREWVARMIRNLMRSFSEAGRQDDYRAMREMLYLVNPHEADDSQLPESPSD